MGLPEGEREIVLGIVRQFETQLTDPSRGAPSAT
jgi:hypothetical protein